MMLQAAGGGRRGRMAVCNRGYLLGAHALLATVLWSSVASADRARVVEPAAVPNARSGIMLVQTFHARPGVPGSGDSGDLGGSTDGSHPRPGVPNVSDSGGTSGGSHGAPAVSNGGSSHAAPGLPGFSEGAGKVPERSHAPAPNGAGGSHAAPGVPMMGGNP